MNESREAAWYRDGLQFECTQCGDCCRGHGYVWVDTDEIERLAAHFGLEHQEFCQRYLRRVNGALCLLDKPNLDCIFWQEGPGCTVYEARPGQCRSFPFWQENLRSPEDWRRIERTCPGSGTGRSYDLYEIQAIARGESET